MPSVHRGVPGGREGLVERDQIGGESTDQAVEMEGLGGGAASVLGALAASPIRSRGVGVVRWWAAEARRRGGRRPVSVSRSSARSFGTRSRSVLTASEAAPKTGGTRRIRLTR